MEILFKKGERRRVVTALIVATVLGSVVSAFALYDLSNSVFPEIGYVSLDELGAIIWLMGFAVYLVILTNLGLAGLFFFTISWHIRKWASGRKR